MLRFRTVDLAPLPPQRSLLRPDSLALVSVVGGFCVHFVGLSFGRLVPPQLAMTAVFGLIGIVYLWQKRQSSRVPRAHGGVFAGRIESKLGPFAVQVVDGELRACPFVVRLDDGRVALVDDAALVLETENDSVELDVGATIELVGNPTLTPYAPEGYRGASALRFQGEYGAPVGIRET